MGRWVWAPPHTRGSTRPDGDRMICYRGSPAHAGIDPAVGFSALPRYRLPRTRGDRPTGRYGERDLELAPPHTRGSTGPGPLWHHHAAGSPAHAGIDLRSAELAVPVNRLPRTRGDRPGVRRQCVSPAQAPPHTRGSTSFAEFVSHRRPGSPAHAGIDLSMPPEARHVRGLPRTRGDRPSSVSVCSRINSAPPHTRGSTLHSKATAKADQGSPAHAGIDRLIQHLKDAGLWLPRTRGDRPRWQVPAVRQRPAPPHTRGSTL